MVNFNAKVGDWRGVWSVIVWPLYYMLIIIIIIITLDNFPYAPLPTRTDLPPRGPVVDYSGHSLSSLWTK